MQETKDWLERLLKQKSDITLEGDCHDCKKQDIKKWVAIHVWEDKAGKYLENGMVWKVVGIDEPFFKCPDCFDKDPVLRNFQPTEVYSRVVGYLRPIKQWNKGKQEEFKLRKNFKV